MKTYNILLAFTFLNLSIIFTVKGQFEELRKQQKLSWIELKGPENIYYYLILKDSIMLPIPDPPYMYDTIGYSLKFKNPNNTCKKIVYSIIYSESGKIDSLSSEYIYLKPNSEYECYETVWWMCERSFYLDNFKLINIQILSEETSEGCKILDKLKFHK